MTSMIDKKELFDFVDRAGKATYAGGGKNEKYPESQVFSSLFMIRKPLGIIEIDTRGIRGLEDKKLFD